MLQLHSPLITEFSDRYKLFLICVSRQHFACRVSYFLIKKVAFICSTWSPGLGKESMILEEFLCQMTFWRWAVAIFMTWSCLPLTPWLTRLAVSDRRHCDLEIWLRPLTPAPGPLTPGEQAVLIMALLAFSVSFKGFLGYSRVKFKVLR